MKFITQHYFSNSSGEFESSWTLLLCSGFFLLGGLVVTRTERIRNTRIRGTAKVTEISRKIHERRRKEAMIWTCRKKRSRICWKEAERYASYRKRDRGRKNEIHRWLQWKRIWKKSLKSATPKNEPLGRGWLKMSTHSSGKRRSKSRFFLHFNV